MGTQMQSHTIICSLATISNNETILQDFLEADTRVSRKKYFLGTTWTVILPAGSNLQPHTGVLSGVKKYWMVDVSFQCSD